LAADCDLLMDNRGCFFQTLNMDAILINRWAIHSVTSVKIADICKKLGIFSKLHQIVAFPTKVTDASG